MSPEPRNNPLELERAALRELDEAELARVRAERGDALRALEAQDGEDRRALFERLPPRTFRERIEARAAAQPTRGALFFAPVLAAALVLVMWLAPEREGFSATDLEVTRTKGLVPVLQVFRKRGTDSEELRAGAEARANDVLQLRYAAAGRPYGLILSLDGGGTVTVHEQGPKLEPSGAHLLDRAYVLDTAPSFERFVLITSARAFDPAEVLAAAEARAKSPDAGSAPLDLPPTFEQTFLLLRKADP